MLDAGAPFSSTVALKTAAEAPIASEDTAKAAAATLAKVLVNFIFLSSIKYFSSF